MRIIVLSTWLAVASCTAAAAVDADEQKRVLNTPWWPPGTEKSAESIGIASHGLIFMTAMMELNTTVNLTMQNEVSDVSDIAKAGNATLDDLVDCYLHAPRGHGSEVRAAFSRALPSRSTPAITVIETLGEYSWANTSATCLAARPSSPGAHDGLSVRHDGSVAAAGLLFMPGISASVPGGTGAEVNAVFKQVERMAGGRRNLLDCVAFVHSVGDIHIVREYVSKRFVDSGSPAVSIIQAGLEDASRRVTLKCIAALETRGVVRTHQAAATSQYVFVSGQLAQQANGTDAMAAVGQLLRPYALSLRDVVNCAFFVHKLDYMQDLFGGFYKVFNVDNFPPPSRGEFADVGLEGTNCSILAKCVAARPLDTDPLVV